MIASQFRDVFMPPSYHDLRLGHTDHPGINHGSPVEQSRHPETLGILSTVEATDRHHVGVAST